MKIDKKCIITVKVDVTDQFAMYDWTKWDDQKIIEWFGDTPEIINESLEQKGFYCGGIDNGDAYIVKKVERV